MYRHGNGYLRKYDLSSPLKQSLTTAVVNISDAHVRMLYLAPTALNKLSIKEIACC